MSTAHDVLRKHIGNPDEIITLFEDFIFSLGVSWLVDRLKDTLETEHQYAAKHHDSGNPQGAVYFESEALKLQNLITELETITQPTDKQMAAAIEKRYMINPLRKE